MAHAKSLRDPLLWTAYVLLPAGGWGLFHGAPVGLFGAAVLFAIWWTWVFRGWVPGRSILVLLLLVKLVFSLVQVDRGLEADYFGNAQWTPPVEHSTEFPRRSSTRIDPRLAFGAPGAPDFPLYFFNDSSRFNYYLPGDPNRATLPFSATWQGYTRARTEEDRRTFYLHGKGVTAELWVDGAQTVRLEPSAEEAIDRARWPAGMRHLTVRVSSATGGGHEFEAGFMDANGKKLPFSETDFVTKAFPAWRLTADRIVRLVSLAIDAVLLAILAWCAIATFLGAFRRMRSADHGGRLAVGWLAAMIGGVMFAKPTAGHMILLEGGQDYLTYETYARDILLNGPLMLLGRPIGQAGPFYMQPLYAYFVALTHLVFGEDLSGIYLSQWVLAWATVLAVWRISARLFGAQVGRAALALAGIFFVLRLVPLARVLLSENLFIPMLAAWALSMIDMSTPGIPDGRTALPAGIVGGLATLVRSTLLAGWIVVLPLLAWARRRAGKGQQAVAVMLVVMIAIVSLATLRNWIASRTFVPVTASFGVNFYQGNLPPKGVNLGPATDYIGMGLQYARRMPREFLKNMANKGLYTLGFFNPLVPGAGTAPGLVATWWAALIGIAVLLWGNVPEGLGGPARALPFALSASHLIVVTLIFPHVYGDRLILPAYILLLPYAALGMMKAVDFLVPPEEE